MKEKKILSESFILAVVLMSLAAATRFIPHPFNFTALGAIALFSGAIVKDKRLAFLLPISVLLFTDTILGFHLSMFPVYACFAFTVVLGIAIKNKQNIFSIFGASLVSSLVFFLITNLPLWYLDLGLYPMTINGTLESYKMAIPFFRNQLVGDLFYNSLLFGIFYLAVKKPTLFNLKAIFLTSPKK